MMSSLFVCLHCIKSIKFAPKTKDMYVIKVSYLYPCNILCHMDALHLDTTVNLLEMYSCWGYCFVFGLLTYLQSLYSCALRGNDTLSTGHDL